MNLAHFRREYTQAGLDRNDLAPDPAVQFHQWFEQATRAGLTEPNAMTLATVGADGRPSTRTVLLKGLDARGLVFFTNFESRKSRDIGRHAHVALHLRVAGIGAAGVGGRAGRARQRRGIGGVFCQAALWQPTGRVGLGAEQRHHHARGDGKEIGGIESQISPKARCHRRRFGAAFASCRKRGNSGRAGPTACTTASATGANKPPGSLSGCLRRILTTDCTDGRGLLPCE